MIWLFISLSIFCLGSMLEFRTRGYPPLRPIGAADTVWKILGSISGIWFIILFVWMLFALAWWVVILFFVGAATAQGFVYNAVTRLPAMPPISMAGMIIGGGLSALAIHNIQAATL